MYTADIRYLVRRSGLEVRTSDSYSMCTADTRYLVGRSGLEVRTSDLYSRWSGFESSCCRFEVWAILFTPIFFVRAVITTECFREKSSWLSGVNCKLLWPDPGTGHSGIEELTFTF